MSKDWDKLRSLLDGNYEWPAVYTYKFIIQADKVDALKKLFNDFKISEKASSKGKYISITLTKMMNSSEEVIEGYHRVENVEGVISL